MSFSQQKLDKLNETPISLSQSVQKKLLQSQASLLEQSATESDQESLGRLMTIDDQSTNKLYGNRMEAHALQAVLHG
jgi:hypothetical protein